MNNNTIRNLKIENLIWIIYLFISIAALISNYFEEDYIKTKNFKDFRTYKTINIEIFIVAFFIYLYFVYLNYKNISNLKKNASKKKVLIANVNFIASILFLLGGSIYLFTESISQTPDEDAEIEF